MKNVLVLLLLLLLCIEVIRAQNYTVSGYISDSSTKEIMIGATVIDSHSNKGATTNSYGFYSLTLPKGKVSLKYLFMGYKPHETTFNLEQDTILNIPLLVSATEINEVVVTAENNSADNVRSGTIYVPLNKIRNAPALFGESDLMKSLQYIPGVQNTSEGKSDLSIRGGSPDQNLILLDGNPIYNANHVFGFLSVFNTDALKNVTLYKSGFPARFGGRLSSIIDINTKDGNKETYSGSATLGLLALKLNIEGPIVKDKTSFTFSARRSYADLYVEQLQKWLDEDSNSSTNFFFYDLNAKIHHKFNSNTSIYFTAYNGKDRLENTTKDNDIPGEQTNSSTKQSWKWGNTIFATRLNSSLSKNLFMNANLSYNHYNYNTSIDKKYDYIGDESQQKKAQIRLNYDSGIKDYATSLEFEYIPASTHYIRSGVQYIYHDFHPETMSLTGSQSNSHTQFVNPQKVSSNEFSLYTEDDWELSRKLKLNGGFRFSFFNVNGKTYSAIDPRFSIRYLLTDRISVKAGYTHMQQYIHLLSNNSLLLQADLSVPATDRIKPMNSKQYSLGFYMTLPGLFDFIIEGYYKDMKNVIEYIDGVSFSGSSNWEDKVEAGIGRSYGVECSIEKRIGNTTGTFSYAWSKTERKFTGINYGEWFPAKFDRRHNMHINITQKINKKTDIMLNWSFASGNMMTIPLMSVVTPEIPDVTVAGGYGDLAQLDHRNNYRMPAYHRLDVGVNYTPRKKHTKRYGVWNFSIYNVYNRMNPFKMYVDTDVYKDQNGKNVYKQKLKQITLFPIIPSISYTYIF